MISVGSREVGNLSCEKGIPGILHFLGSESRAASTVHSHMGKSLMKKCIPAFLFALLLSLPNGLPAQDVGVGARIGTLGLGVEAALGLNENFVIRGGIGSFIVDFTGDFSDITYTVTPPSLTTTLGVDIYPTGGSFRLMGGLMYRSEDIRVDSDPITPGSPIEIGDNEYDEAGTLHGELDTKSTAPFVGFGFGRHTSGGFGVSFDLGVAFVGEPNVVLTADGALGSAEGIDEDLRIEEEKFKDDVGQVLQYWPILSFGLKIPLNLGG
jgi:hypothetical protein